jgi:hypothetical protein
MRFSAQGRTVERELGEPSGAVWIATSSIAFPNLNPNPNHNLPLESPGRRLGLGLGLRTESGGGAAIIGLGCD